MAMHASGQSFATHGPGHDRQMLVHFSAIVKVNETWSTWEENTRPSGIFTPETAELFSCPLLLTKRFLDVRDVLVET